MPQSNDDARKELVSLVIAQERDASWVARRIGKSYQWVYRRFSGTTAIDFDDYNLILSALDRELSR